MFVHQNKPNVSNKMTFEEWWEQVEAYGLGLPEGYVLVPVEPTEKMIEAGNSLSYMTCDVIYRAMIKVAQEKSDD